MEIVVAKNKDQYDDYCRYREMPRHAFIYINPNEKRTWIKLRGLHPIPSIFLTVPSKEFLDEWKIFFLYGDWECPVSVGHW